MSGRAVGVARLFAGKDVFGEMQETGEGDVPPPSPSAPPPRGDSPSIQCRGIWQSLRGLTGPPPKILPQPMARLSRANRQTLPAPFQGAGGGRVSGRAVGVARLFAGKDVFGEMQETGEGNVPSPSPSAPPPRGDSPSIRCRGIWQSLRGLT